MSKISSIQPDAATASGTEETKATAVVHTASTTLAPAQHLAGKSDDDVVKEIRKSCQGNLFQSLMDGTAQLCEDALRAVMTLLCIIANFTQDADQIGRIFRRSKIVPTWWDNNAVKDGNVSEDTFANYYIRRAMATFHITVPTILGPRRIADLCPDRNPLYTMDDVGNAHLFSQLYATSLLFCKDLEHWFNYDGTRWVMDDGRAMELCKLLTVALSTYARKCAAIDYDFFPPVKRMKRSEYIKKDPYVKHAEHCKSRRVRETILKDAKTDDQMVIALKMFDADPYLFNCKNGTLDLRNFTLNPHNPDDYLTKMANVDYDPKAKSKLWERHILTVMEGDADTILFFEKALGYALTGSNKYACIIILFGPKSRNGKSVTMDTFNTMMGDYGGAANPETFAQKFNANGSSHSEDLAELAGKRFVSVPEAEGTMTLSSSLVKRCTGDGEITARHIYEKQFSYAPQFKLFFHTNHLPRINDMAMFESNRVKVIPFKHYFQEKDRNPNMLAELTTPDNLSAILNWALEGWMLLEATGFQPPQAVLDATAEYRWDSDRVGNFMSECMYENPNGCISTRDVFAMYKLWCDNSGLRPGREQDFKKALAHRGINSVRVRVPDGRQITVYQGWGIVS